MKNKEFLIEIILHLRGRGVRDQSILSSIEKIPPHYYTSIQKKKYSVELNEISEIVKLLDFLNIVINKVENCLIIGQKQGWILAIASLLCKRVYSICSTTKKRMQIESILHRESLKNIYLKDTEDFFYWKKISPFDLIIVLKFLDHMPSKFTKYLSHKGQLLTPLGIDNDIKFFNIKKNQEKKMLEIDYSVIKKSNII